MDDKEKLKHLISHWKDHNAEHASVYKQWAAKMEKLQEKNAEKILTTIARKTEELEKSFQELANILT